MSYARDKARKRFQKDADEKAAAKQSSAAKPASGPRSSKLASSTSIGIAVDLWVRRLTAFLGFDFVMIFVVCVGFILMCNQSLPSEALGWGGLLYAPGVKAGFTGSLADWQNACYTVAYNGATYSFGVASGVAFMKPIAAFILFWQVVSLIDGAMEPRRIRKRLKPLNDLALTAEAIGSVTAGDPTGAGVPATMDKIEHLRHAIDSASVDAPNVSTGDKDLRSIEVALNGLLRQMQEAKLQQMQFVNDASHELRTPIAVIQGYVNMLDRWGKTDESVLDESIAALKQESSHMKELVEQLLFLARGDSGRNNLHFDTFDLAEVVNEVLEESAMIDVDHEYVLVSGGRNLRSLRSHKDESGAPVPFPQMDSPLPMCPMVGDEAMVKQAMRILVQNAAKYSEAGTAITLGVQSDGGFATCTVQDEGVGLTEAELPHVFERFWRSDSARSGSAGGTGLGLAIAKWIVDAHEGTIGVVSHKGIGTRFALKFPTTR